MCTFTHFVHITCRVLRNSVQQLKSYADNRENPRQTDGRVKRIPLPQLFFPAGVISLLKGANYPLYLCMSILLALRKLISDRNNSNTALI